MVSRPLNAPVAGAVAAHDFIVVNAKYPGDPGAKVYSYGNDGNGNMGRVTEKTRGMSRTTSAEDKAAWKELATNPETKVDYRKINSPDTKVEALAKGICEDLKYSITPGLDTNKANSNSAAGAIANRADGGPPYVPGGLYEPGSRVDYRVQCNCSNP